MTTAMPAIERQDSESKGVYVIRLADGARAEMTYSRAGPTRIIIDHTAVPGSHRGEGLGEAMVLRAVEDARTEGRLIMPLCPFARAQFARHREWHDVLDR